MRFSLCTLTMHTRAYTYMHRYMHIRVAKNAQMMRSWVQDRLYTHRYTDTYISEWQKRHRKGVAACTSDYILTCTYIHTYIHAYQVGEDNTEEVSQGALLQGARVTIYIHAYIHTYIHTRVAKTTQRKCCRVHE